MRTKDEIIQKSVELTATIQEAQKRNLTEAQDLALKFALRITSVSRTIVFLTNTGAAIEAHTICRLLFEYLFNFGALLHKEKHRDVLLEHSMGEPGRQLKKIIQEDDQSATLTPENVQRATEYLSHPDRKNDPKTGLNWEQIARSGATDCLYLAYKQYSFLYAHATLASLLKEVSEQDTAQLHENVWTVLEMARLLLRTKLLNAANQTKE